MYIYTLCSTAGLQQSTVSPDTTASSMKRDQTSSQPALSQLTKIWLPTTSFITYSPSLSLSTAIDDLFDVEEELEPVTERWKQIGKALRLRPQQLNVIEAENRKLCDCLSETLSLWLNKSYNTERFGEPSWELLAGAVAHRSGGNNPALAEDIRNRH